MNRILTFCIVATCALVLGGAVGFLDTGTTMGAVNGLIVVAVLSLMETAESMDNAIVDYRILRRMSEVWQRRYLAWGMPVAVIGMRFIFPMLIVSLFASIAPWDAAIMAVRDPQQYATLVESAQSKIDAFGGAFLMLIALDFFFQTEKDGFWLPWLESPASKLAGIDGIIYGIVLTIVIVVSFIVPDPFEFLLCGSIGIAAYILIKNALGWAIGDDSAQSVLRGGFLSFAYLEFIDASFSLDSVISAFAITINPVAIAIGLGLGALAVRQMTLAMLRAGKESEGGYAYVEHGAFYTILILSFIMLISTIMTVPEYVTGSIGIVLIGGSFLASVWKNRH